MRVEESPAPYADADYMAVVDLIVQTNTMSTIEPEEFAGLRRAIENGAGLGGWHGGIADSYRNNVSTTCSSSAGSSRRILASTRMSAPGNNLTITCHTRCTCSP